MSAYRTLTYRGQCIHAAINAETGEEQYTVYNWSLRAFRSLAGAHAQIDAMLFSN